jgi:hypothetical protein
LSLPSRTSSAVRAPRYVGFALVALLLAAEARAEAPQAGASMERKRQCVSNHVEAQRQLKTGALLKARGLLLECLRSGCGDVLREDCIRLLSEVQEGLATIRVNAIDELGLPAVLEQVWLDGAQLPLSPGEPITLDPGRHELKGKSQQGEWTTLVIDVLAGAREEPVVLRLEAGPSAPGASGAQRPIVSNEPAPLGRAPKGQSPATLRPRTDPSPTAVVPLSAATPAEPVDPGATARGWAYGIGALGLTSLGAFAVLGGLGLSTQSDLEDNCAPHCTTDDVRGMDRLYSAADLCLAISVTALASAAVLFFTAPDPPESTAFELGQPLRSQWRF